MTFAASERKSPTASSTTKRPPAPCPSLTCNGNVKPSATTGYFVYSWVSGRARWVSPFRHYLKPSKRFSNFEFLLCSMFLAGRGYLSVGMPTDVAQALEAVIVVWVIMGFVDTLIVHNHHRQVCCRHVHRSLKI